MVRQRTPLRVAHTAKGVTDTLGPGRRSVVWVQGCTIHCPGCIVPETWGSAEGTLLDPVDLARSLLDDDPQAGLTVSGGEPSEQPSGVADLLETAHERGRTTWVYTGRIVEDLLASDDPQMLRMLASVDVLVDGRYDADRADARAYRGSANQRTLRLTDAISLRDATNGAAGRVDLRVDDTGQLLVVGIPAPEFLTKLKAGLQSRGLAVRTEGRWR